MSAPTASTGPARARGAMSFPLASSSPSASGSAERHNNGSVLRAPLPPTASISRRAGWHWSSASPSPSRALRASCRSSRPAMPADAPHLHVDAAYGLLIRTVPGQSHRLPLPSRGRTPGHRRLRPPVFRAQLHSRLRHSSGRTDLDRDSSPGLDTLFGLAPLFSHDVWLHGIEALAAAYVGWVMVAPNRSSDGRGSRAA